MFNELKTQVQKRFEELTSSGQPLFYIDIDRDVIWEKYLSGFDADPVEKQGHNCNSCKSFLRQYAGIVSIQENKVQTIWDFFPEEVFAPSIENIRDYIVHRPITDVFVNPFVRLGTDKNVDSKDNTVVWHHFSLDLPKQYVHKSTDTIDSFRGNARDNKAVLKRSLDELTLEATDTALELIAQNSLYRGKEFEGLLTTFRNLQRVYKDTPAGLKDNFCWATSVTVGESVTRIRNTSIGTLLVNLSEGMDLDSAVTKFEAVVAPTNYKRPTSLVTPRMVEDAKAKINELGYLSALERRFATSSDLNINDVVFVDKSSSLTDVFEDMKKDATINPRSLSKTEEIDIGTFMASVLPHAKAVHVLLENSHLPNMMTLLTGQEPSLFKWDNPFSWAYTGGITDSIKERVKQAGGKVDGELRVSLSWHNFDDLDLHITEPRGHHIYYADKINPRTLGNLDVDMNAHVGTSRNAVENTVWPTPDKMEEGRYTVTVHNFSQRESTGIGFTVQIECRGEVFDLEFPKNPRNHEFQEIVQFDYSRRDGLKMVGEIKSNVATKEKWNLKTNRFHKVKHILGSPNCWNGVDHGNKHLFFILENCASDESTRPFFNEFLKEDLAPHRKFFEVLAGKLLVSPTTTQLAGVGFSETKRNHLYVRVDGAFQRTLKINF